MKSKRLLLTLVTSCSLGLLANMVQNTEQVHAADKVSVIDKVRDMADENNLSKNWVMEEWDYTSEAHPERIFRQGMHNAELGRYTVGVNFANYKVDFKATRSFPMKAGKTYKIKATYDISVGNVDLAKTYIDFNGKDRFNKPTVDGVYEDTYKATKDENYTITFSMKTYGLGNQWMDIRCLEDGGFTEVETVSKPEGVSAKSSSNSILGFGTAGNTIIVKDDAGNTIGTGIVTEEGTFKIIATEQLEVGNVLSVYQKDSAGEMSEPALVTVAP